jgi:trans-aconitate methyltransferase
LDLCRIAPDDSVVDVGGGASILVDELLDRGFSDLTVLDISVSGLKAARQRLGESARRVQWMVTDVLTWRPGRTFRVWHDRALFHFVTEERDRRQYLTTLNAATTPSAVAVFATFAPDGPEQCSGLPVSRYSARELAGLLSPDWNPVSDAREEHTTPGGFMQPFTWAAFRRL